MAPCILEYGTGSTPAPVTGRLLAHNRYDAIGRAFLAADLHSGTKVLVRPTMVQAARLARISAAYAWAADRRQDERAAIEAGLIPLVPARAPAPAINGFALPVSITGGAIADADVLSFVRSVGVNRVLEAAVAVEAAQ